jgi:type IV secretory pathway TraG/TraD family ATPase VirD4
MIASLFDRWLRRSRKPCVEPALTLGPHDALTMSQLYEGCLIVGGTGSGKTTGPGEAVARFLLRQGAGVLWLTAKADEFERAERLCRQTGRFADLVRFAPGEQSFNFLDFELGSDGGGVTSAANLLSDLVDFASRSGSNQGSDPFWPQAASRLLRMALTLCHAARRPCTIEHLYKFISSLPTKETLHDPSWRDGFCAKTIGMAASQQPSPEFDLAAVYVLQEWASLADRTSSSILSQAMNVVDRFMSGEASRLVASERSTITPLDLEQGKVVVLDAPVLRYREPGQLVQVTFKLSAIRSVLRRSVDGSTRPVAILADEGQLFAVPRADAMTQAVGRSSRLVNVVMTQNLPGIIQALGGAAMEKEALSWIANFSTKIACANADAETNQFMSDLAGKSRHLFFGGSASQEPFDLMKETFGQGMQSTASFNEQWFPDVPPEVFVSQLRRGGPEEKFCVDAVVMQTGRRFSNSKPFLFATFQQEFDHERR